MSSVSNRNARPKSHAGPAKKPQRAFGGYRKRTITARQFVASMVALAPEACSIYQVWAKHDLDPSFRAELMFAGSLLNDCRYCTWGHHEWANTLGVSDEELAHIEQMDPSGFDRRKWIAISYVRALVSADFAEVAVDLGKEMRANYTAREVKDIDLVARVMNIANRGGNTWDAMLSRLRGAPSADSRVFDEIVLSGAFLVTVPIVLLLLSRASHRSFFGMARSLIDYTKHYEEKNAVPAQSE